MLITKKVMVKWNSKTREHYESKGYIFTKSGDEFEVKTEDLSKGSRIPINVKCDCEDCKNPYLKPMRWSVYVKYIKDEGKYYCNNCIKKLYATHKTVLTKLKNSISFKQWCVDNNRQDVLDKWDYELNDKNPNDITFTSHGLNEKGYWFKCLEHPEHGSELKHIHGFTNGQEGSICCNQCSKIYVTHPKLIKYFVNIDDTKKYSHGSKVNVDILKAYQ